MHPILHRRVSRSVAVVAALGMALTVAISAPGGALALPKEGVGYTDCVYNGQTYSHGSVITMANGRYYKCDNGQWTWTPSGTYTDASADNTLVIGTSGSSGESGIIMGTESALAPSGQAVLAP